VWNRDQVRGLMRSLYLGFPVGALLVWETEGSEQAVRGGASVVTGQKQLLIDGQQRVTTLFGIIRGEPPTFFEGDLAAFSDLRFNVETEQFQFHAPVKMKGDPLWIDVTAAFRDGPGAVLADLLDLNWVRPKLTVYMDRISRLTSVLHREFHVEQITGPDKTVDVVVDIFNRVNSGGTKLSKGDLALARICSEWSEARPTMRRNIERWRNEGGFNFTPDWLLRNVNAVATGKAPFSHVRIGASEGDAVAAASTADEIDPETSQRTPPAALHACAAIVRRSGSPVGQASPNRAYRSGGAVLVLAAAAGAGGAGAVGGEPGMSSGGAGLPAVEACSATRTLLPVAATVSASAVRTSRAARQPDHAAVTSAS
jgi:hypothetical protein